MSARLRLIFFSISLLLAACGPLPPNTAGSGGSSEVVGPRATTTLLSSPTFTASVAPNPTFTPTSTSTPNVTPTPTLTPTASNTSSPTYAFPAVVVTMQAHCRYGPSKAYLHAADLFAGDTGTVRGRFQNSQWLLVKFDKLGYFCWVAPSVVEVTGDISLIKFTEPRLPGPSVLYDPPAKVWATRDKNQVTINWSRVKMTADDDRGYFIEAWVCQNGAYIWWTVSFADQYVTSYTVQDDRSGCAGESKGKLYAVEKHGYTRPVTIPWP